MENRRQLQRDLIWIFALGLLFRIALLIFFPVPYGNDAAGRLYFRDSILTWHWLPATQALVHFSYAFTHSIVIVRLVFALAGSLAAVAFAFYLQTFAPRRAALIGGALFAINSHAVFLSLMPYQEIVFLGLLFASLAFFIREQTEPATRDFIIASTFYGLACLTRYEAWFILPALLLARIWRRFAAHGIRGLLHDGTKTFIGFCWGPALWLFINWRYWGSPTAFLFHRADHAFYAWSPHGEIARIVDYIGLMLYWLVRFGSPLVLLALPGVWLVWKNRRKLFPVLWPLLLLFLLVLLFLILVAGKEFSTANRFAMIPLSVVLIFAALGTDDFLQRLRQSSWLWLQQPALKKIAAGVLLLLLLIYGAMPVARSNRLADFREPYEIAQFLKAHLASGESAVIVAASFDGEVPMPYQRVFGQLDFDQKQLLCAGLIDPRRLMNAEAFVQQNNLRYLVVFESGPSRNGSDGVFLRLIAETAHRIKKVFSNHAAIIYERI